jgi:peptidoglycan/LPS O-acetylase OafA/YrhL
MQRSIVIDIIKVMAFQIIVMHHLSHYAPMTDWISAVWPGQVGFIYEDGRLAVQPFLVIGGYLVALSLNNKHTKNLASLIWRRYLRLAPQLMIALLLVIFATLWLGDELSDKDWLSPLPSMGVFLAHLFFLQDVLGIPSMSAGAWYVAIDLQLFGLFALLARISKNSQKTLSESWMPAMIAACTVVSIYIFSRHATLDAWAIYYLWAYGLGALVAWARQSPRARVWLTVTVGLLLLDWLLDPRARPVIVLLTVGSLYSLSHISWFKAENPIRKFIHYFSDISYSIFVSHFAVIIVVSGIWEKFELEGLGLALIFVVLAWLGSIVVGIWVQYLYDQIMRLVYSNH